MSPLLMVSFSIATPIAGSGLMTLQARWSDGTTIGMPKTEGHCLKILVSVQVLAAFRPPAGYCGTDMMSRCSISGRTSPPGGGAVTIWSNGATVLAQLGVEMTGPAKCCPACR